jgi:hypothetical protein
MAVSGMLSDSGRRFSLDICTLSSIMKMRLCGEHRSVNGKNEAGGRDGYIICVNLRIKE